MPPAMLDLFGKYGITILQGYGMTECAPVISTTVSWNVRKGSVGQLVPNCEAKVVDEELWVRGSSVMQGYYKMPKETEETLVDGWLRTGDLGLSLIHILILGLKHGVAVHHSLPCGLDLE